MDKTIKLLRQGFKSSSQTTEEFKSFFSVFKKEMTQVLKNFGATNIEFNRGHFYVSGFFDVADKVYYFSTSDVRGLEYKSEENYDILVRTARDHKDYSGGSNRFCKLNSMEDDLHYIIH